MAPVLILEGKRSSPRLADFNKKTGRTDHAARTPEAGTCYYCVERTPKETIWQNDYTSGRQEPTGSSTKTGKFVLLTVNLLFSCEFFSEVCLQKSGLAEE